MLVLRDETERPEGVEAGAALLVGPHRGAIVEAASRLLSDPVAYGQMAKCRSLYGDGQTGKRIVDILLGSGACSPKAAQAVAVS